MTKKVQKKWKYKFLTEEQFEEYKEMSKDEIIENLKTRLTYLDNGKREKKFSEELKNLRSQIKEHRDNWEGNDQIEDLQDEIKSLKEKRDREIEDVIEDKIALEGGYKDTIKSAEEHRDALLYALRFHN